MCPRRGLEGKQLADTLLDETPPSCGVCACCCRSLSRQLRAVGAINVLGKDVRFEIITWGGECTCYLKIRRGGEVGYRAASALMCNVHMQVDDDDENEVIYSFPLY